jgi:glyoxylase-like metal-dependent hydrolase (beta-lactamase superfamily II)
MRFVFEQVRVGGDRNFGYLLGDRMAGEGILVDPSYDPGALVARAKVQGLRITAILNTHGHADHSNGNAEAQALTGAPVWGGPGHPGPLDRVLEDRAEIPLGVWRLGVWRVPGHCPDHLAFLVEGSTGSRTDGPAGSRAGGLAAGLTGDLLFVGKVGGTPGDREARTEWDSLQRLLREWPAHATLWPGHDYGARPSSTLAWERETNPFLLCPDVQAFIRLKGEWPSFKAAHGLR